MKTYNRSTILGSAFVVFSFLLLIFASTAFAAVMIENRTGTITITMPNNEVISVQADQPLPAIPSGATIAVVTGSADISATEGDSVSVMVNNSTAIVEGGAKVSAGVDLSTGDGTLNVLSGSVKVTQADGTMRTIAAGETISAPAGAPVSAASLGVPGTDPVKGTGRDEDVKEGLVKGY